jgi:phosphoglycolate phosphatase-like HAD superfamily hydrolase
MRTAHHRMLFTGMLACLFALPSFGATIIFDIGGVLVKNSKLGLAQEIGFFTGILPYLLCGNSPSKLMDSTFETLEYLFGTQQAADGKPLAWGEGRPLPLVMCHWLGGTVAAKDIIAEAHRLIDAGACDHILRTVIQKICVKRVIACAFDPGIFARHTFLIPSGVRLVQACQRAGHRVLILSNYATDAFAACMAKPDFKTFFTSVGMDNIVLSGAIHRIKPHDDIFEYVMQTYHLNPRAERVIFIDDQAENIAAAAKQGILGLQLINGDYATLYLTLKDLGIPVRELEDAIFAY